MKIFKIIVLAFLSLFFVNCFQEEDVSSGSNEFYNLTGKSIDDFVDTENYDLVVINFWATFCSPCKKEIPELVKLNNEFQNVLFIGASIDSEENFGLIEKISKALKINYPVFYGVESEYRNDIITGLPTTFFLDKNKNVVDKIINKRSYEDFREIITKHLENSTIDKVISESSFKSETDYFVFESLVDIVKGKLIIKIDTIDDYHLNGEGYPPLKIKLESSEFVSLSTSTIEEEGIGENQSKIWEIPYSKTSRTPETIDISISAIACIDDSCNFVKEKYKMEL